MCRLATFLKKENISLRSWPKTNCLKQIRKTLSRSRRFNPELSANKEWTKARSHEAYAKNYATVFPHDEPLAGRNMRKDPLYEVSREPGREWWKLKKVRGFLV